MQIDPTNEGQASTFPLIIGVTGHRDIAPAARQVVANAVGTLLCNLKHRFGNDACMCCRPWPKAPISSLPNSRWQMASS